MTLYEPVHERFARFCQVRTHNEEDAKDLVSETVLVAYEGFEKIKNKKAFIYYLFGVASRLIKRKYRTNKFWGTYDHDHAMEVKDPAINPEVAMDIQILYEALGKLPDKYKNALILFEISGFSLKEIQEIEGGTLSAIKSRVTRGREKLAKLIRDVVFDPNEGKSTSIKRNLTA